MNFRAFAVALCSPWRRRRRWPTNRSNTRRRRKTPACRTCANIAKTCTRRRAPTRWPCRRCTRRASTSTATTRSPITFLKNALTCLHNTAADGCRRRFVHAERRRLYRSNDAMKFRSAFALAFLLATTALARRRRAHRRRLLGSPRRRRQSDRLVPVLGTRTTFIPRAWSKASRPRATTSRRR